MEFENIRSEDDGLKLLQIIKDHYPAFLAKQIPEGWQNSDCVLFFHPTTEQQFEEHRRINENMRRLFKDKKEKEQELILSDFKQDLTNIDENKEPLTLLGLCLWDIFSDNHTVKDAQNHEFEFGSFRSCAGLIARVVGSASSGEDDFFNMDYLDFYMGTIWIKNRGDLQPFYEFIFRILKKENCDWIYSFPRLGIVDFSDKIQPAPEDYDPANAMEKELKGIEITKMKEELDRSYESEYEEARYKKPSSIVMAYRNVFGDWPTGHPLNA
jgi:hypothetical protein